MDPCAKGIASASVVATTCVVTCTAAP
jgi:hypothetical protein